MNIFSTLWRKRWILRAIFPSIFFNLRHLPLTQAVHLPILIYKTKLVTQSGSFRIDGPVRFGMIRLGVNIAHIFPDNGIVIENTGTIVFKGNTVIGNDSALCVGKDGVLTFGTNFNATCGFRIVCFHFIAFDENVLVGWNNLITDTDFHMLKFVNRGGYSKGYGFIQVGHDVWIANGCKIYKNVSIPHSCIVGADTILHRSITCNPYSLITNQRATIIKADGIFHDKNDDKIIYHKQEDIHKTI